MAISGSSTITALPARLRPVFWQHYQLKGTKVERVGRRIELPQFRDASGVWRPAITLPEEVRGPIGDECSMC
jgi:hypothetical protein